jgi:hypothetical protein
MNYHLKLISLMMLLMILALFGCAQMTIYPTPTKAFIQKPYYQASYDSAWDTVLEVLGEERVGTAYQNKNKGRIITGYFTQAKAGANVQNQARWSYTITLTQLSENRTKIDIVCKIEQYLKGWGLVAYEWRDITDVSGYKNIAHSLEKWLYEKIEKRNIVVGGESFQKPASSPETPIDNTERAYSMYKGIVLMNGDYIRGKILSVENNVLKIRTQEGKVLLYDYEKDVKAYLQ